MFRNRREYEMSKLERSDDEWAEIMRRLTMRKPRSLSWRDRHKVERNVRMDLGLEDE